jgi:hypothetical protein
MIYRASNRPDRSSEAYKRGRDAYIASFRDPMASLDNPFDAASQPDQYDDWDAGILDEMRGRS